MESSWLDINAYITMETINFNNSLKNAPITSKLSYQLKPIKIIRYGNVYYIRKTSIKQDHLH